MTELKDLMKTAQQLVVAWEEQNKASRVKGAKRPKGWHSASAIDLRRSLQNHSQPHSSSLAGARVQPCGRGAEQSNAKRVRLADACSLGERSAEWVGPCLCLEACLPTCRAVRAYVQMHIAGRSKG